MREPVLIAFTTASSEAALPKALEVMERFGVPKSSSAFVLPTGYSFNLDGTTLYLSLASVFVAQIAGVELTFGQQIVMMLTLMLTSKGVAGVPRAALVVLTATLTTFGLPLEGAAILLGVDQILDMGRTAVNVMGNCMATAVVARWEGVLDDGAVRRGRMKVAVVGAAGQLGRVTADWWAATHDVVPLTRREVDLDRTGGARSRLTDARARPRHQLRRLQRRRRRRERCGHRAARSMRIAVRSMADGRRRASAPRSSTTAPTSCSTAQASRALHRSGRGAAAERLRRVEAARGVARRRPRRAPTCCASRACSAASTSAAASTGSSRRLRGRGSAACSSIAMVTPSYVADVVRATAALVERTTRRRASITASTAAATTWLGLGEELARLLGTAAQARLRPVRDGRRDR